MALCSLVKIVGWDDCGICSICDFVVCGSDRNWLLNGDDVSMNGRDWSMNDNDKSIKCDGGGNVCVVEMSV